jgi:hypothetical protein
MAAWNGFSLVAQLEDYLMAGHGGENGGWQCTDRQAMASNLEE